jgi:hypothetical protein
MRFQTSFIPTFIVVIAASTGCAAASTPESEVSAEVAAPEVAPDNCPTCILEPDLLVPIVPSANTALLTPSATDNYNYPATVTVSFRIKNQGNAAVSGEIAHHVVLRPETALNTVEADRWIYTRGTIPAGGYIDVSVSFDWGTLIANGTFHQTTIRTDATNLVVESNEANNTTVVRLRTLAHSSEIESY